MFVLQLQILAQYREEKLEEFPNSNYEPTLKALGMYWSALFLFSLHSLQTKWEEKHRWCLALYHTVWSPGHRCSEDLQRWAFYPEEWTKIHFFLPQLNMVLDHGSGGSGSHSLENPYGVNKRTRKGGSDKQNEVGSGNWVGMDKSFNMEQWSSSSICFIPV